MTKLKDVYEHSLQYQTSLEIQQALGRCDDVTDVKFFSYGHPNVRAIITLNNGQFATGTCPDCEGAFYIAMENAKNILEGDKNATI